MLILSKPAFFSLGTYLLAIDRSGRYLYAGTSQGAFGYQYNCSYSISSASQPLSGKGGTGSIIVTASNGCSWRVKSRDSWLTTSSSGTGNGTIYYSVTANLNNTPRTGTLDFVGLNFQTINSTTSINQAATIANTSTTVTSSANPSTYNQPVTFTAIVTPDFGSSGTPTGTITFKDNGVPIGTGTVTSSGQANVSLIANTPDLPLFLSTDGTDIFATGANSGVNSVFKVPLGGGAAVPVYSNVGPSPSALVVAGSDLIWIDANSGPTTDTQILKAPKDGSGKPIPIYTGANVGQPIVDGYGLAFDGAKLYTADEVQGRVHGLNFDGSNLAQIGPNRYTGFFETEHINTIAESGGILYVADSGCKPCRDGSTQTPKIVSIPTNGQTFTTFHKAKRASPLWELTR